MTRSLRSPWWSLFVVTAFTAGSLTPRGLSAQARPGRPVATAPADEEADTGGEGQEQTAATAHGPTGGVNALTGYELELHGTAAAHGGRTVRLRGVGYEVYGLATLRAVARVPVVIHEVRDGRIGPQTLADTVTDASGRFSVEVPVVGTIQFTVGRGERARRITYGLSAHSPDRLEMLTDRVLYEPGEIVHAWARLTDVPTGAPIAGTRVELTIAGNGSTTSRLANALVRTTQGGIAVLDLPLPATVPDGALTVTARTGDVWNATVTTSIRVGRRTVERLMAEARVDQQIVAPGARVTGRVTVRTPSGAPVRRATVEVRIDDHTPPVVTETDAEGVASFALAAPAYMATDIAMQMLDIRIVHRAYGTVRTAASFTMARVPYAIEATAGAGGVVPEVTSPVYLALSDPRGEPPPFGTGITVRSVGLPGGRWHGTTDHHGVIEVPLRLPAGSAAQHQVGRCSGRVATSFDVEVESAVPVSARVCVPVAPRASVIARASSPVVAPGARVEVTIERRPSARGHAVAVDLIHRGEDSASTVLATAVVPAAESRVAVALPAGYVGVVRVRARPVEASSAAEGTGATDVVLVRPANAFALRIEPERAQYRVRESARVIVHTPAGLTGARVALVARDLAAHGGERPFALAWLRGTLSQSIADPSTADAERLVRVALAAFTSADMDAARAGPLLAPEGAVEGDDGEGVPGSYDESAARSRDDLRDPFGLRDELLRRGIAPVMSALENALEASLDDTEHTGIAAASHRAFEPFAIHSLIVQETLSSGQAETLGGGEMTLAMLQSADPSFTFDRVARRIARKRLVRLLASLAAYLEPGENGRSTASTEPPDRWLSRMVQRGMINASALRDPWGGSFVLRRVTPGQETVAIAVPASGWELVSPGPDRAAGTGDDVRNPFERVVPAGTVYAVACGEDALMRRLAALDPGHDVLTAVAAAYRRVAGGASEESTGEVITATTSESTPAAAMALPAEPSMDDEEGGSGRRMAPGRHASATTRFAAAEAQNGSGDRDADGVPDAQDVAEMPAQFQQRSEHERRSAHTSEGPRMSQLVALVRERFPATLRMLGESAIDPSGTTSVELSVADALTTYRVDAIVWTADGWTTSASTDVRVDQDAVVDAPVPPFAVVGDVIRIPLRVSNRSNRVIRARVSLAAEGGLRIEAGAPGEVEVAAGDAGEVIVPITVRTPGRGAIVVTATDAANGAPLDAARRPMEVLADARPVRMAVDTLVDGHGSLVFDVPSDASYRADGSVRVIVGGAIFGDPRTWGTRLGDPAWAAWALAMGGTAPTREMVERLVVPFARAGVEPDAYGIDAAVMARAIGALWLSREASDEQLQRGLTSLTRRLEGFERLPRSALTSSLARDVYAVQHAQVLLGLAPALSNAARRGAIAEGLQRLGARLRRSIEANTAPAVDDPARWATAATALLVSSNAPSARAREFLRRAQRGVVRIADEVYLESSPGEPSTRVVPSAVYALASLGTGDRATAFAVARTLARLARTAGRWTAESRALATAMMGRLAPAQPEGRAATVHLVIDGHASDVPLVQGVATFPSAALSQPGRHTVDVTASDGITLIAEAEARYGRPWNAVLASRGPFAITLDGNPGVRDARAALTLRVQNRGPRVIAAPVLEIDLPAGAELDEETRRELSRRTTQAPTLSGRTLVLTLRAMAPGGFVRIPLPVRWSVSGALRGLGVSAYVSDEPGAGTTVVIPRVLDLADGG
ncbi:MAG: MG2 domain-containing protein, partial [Deltaproteobacteria bacterium]